MKKQGLFMSVLTVGLTLALVACRDMIAPTLGAITRTLSSDSTNTIVVTPGAMQGWQFYNDQQDTTCTNAALCRMVEGPAGTPAGSGSAELATAAATDGIALIRPSYRGVRFDQITELRYSTYRQSVDPGNNLSIALQFNADYDLTDASVGYQGRLVFEPYQGNGGNVPQGVWKEWDAKAGKWWGTKASVPKGGVMQANHCVQATPCTWGQLMAAFPDVGVHNTYGAVVLKAGSGWPSFRGNVDQLVIGVNGVVAEFDFELLSPSAVTLTPPDSFPQALFDSLGSISGASISGGPVRKDIIVVTFNLNTPLAARRAAIDSIGGVVVGGQRYTTDHTDDGSYYVQIHGGTTDALIAAIKTLYRQPQVAIASWWELFERDEQAYRRPYDGLPGWRSWLVDPDALNSSRPNWALEYVRAPLAWGCSVGTGETGVAVIDEFIDTTSNTSPNVDLAASNYSTRYDRYTVYGESSKGDHGGRVASVLAAAGNDGKGMTGMVWKTKMIIRDRFASMRHPGTLDSTWSEHRAQLLTDHMVASVILGASVINLSLETSATGFSQTDEQLIRSLEARRSVGLAIQRMATLNYPRHPLIVVAAGNSQTDSYFSGYPAAKLDYPDQVLVVGGLDADGNLWEHSNFGSLVDIYAPAVHVSQANGNNKIVWGGEGTSFAAPLVSGTAVLLKDFDPSLSSKDMIDMIKNGARLENGLPKLDAYGALREAGARRGAPLCGNRLWAAGGEITVDRGATTDILGYASMPDGYGSIYARHGGKILDGWNGTNDYWLQYQPTGWEVLSAKPPVEAHSQARSDLANAYTHDGDTLASALLLATELGSPEAGADFSVSVTDVASGTTRKVYSQHYTDDSGSLVSMAFHPFSGELYFTSNTSSAVVLYATTVGADPVSRVVATLGPRNFFVTHMSINDAGTEIALYVGDFSSYTVLEDSTPYAFPISYAAASCALRFFNIAMTAELRAPVSVPGACIYTITANGRLEFGGNGPSGGRAGSFTP